jgi:hypothetical protein
MSRGEERERATYLFRRTAKREGENRAGSRKSPDFTGKDTRGCAFFR